MVDKDPLAIPAVPKPEAKARPDAKPVARRGRPRAKGPSLEQDIYAFLMMVNMPVSVYAPTRPLKLIDDEMKAMAVSANEAAMANPKVYQYMKSFLGVGKNAGLLAVFGIVIARRAIMVGAVPGVDPSSADDLLMPIRMVAATSTVKVPTGRVDAVSPPPPGSSTPEPVSSPAPATPGGE
jgi:hypothetical protein